MNALLDWVRTHPDLLARTAREHLLLSGLSLALTVAVAVPLGIALARRGGAAAAPTMALVNALRTVPSLALLVVMLPVLGTGTAPSTVALVLSALPTVLLNTVSGVAGVDREIVEAGRGQGLSDRQVLWSVELPLAAPVILAGIRNASVQIVSAATLAVFIGGGGFGELISAGMGLLEFPQLVVGTLAVMGLAAAAEIVFAGAERLVARRVGTGARA